MIKKIISVVITGLIVGTTVALLVQFFLYSIEFLTDIFRKNFNEISSTLQLILYFLIIPLCVGLFVGLIRKFNEGMRWHGPPDVLLSYIKINKD